MSWDYELASELKKLGRQPKTTSYCEATVERENPLTFSVLGGEVLAPPLRLTMTQTARARSWETGDKAAALFGSGLVILDKI